MAISSLRHVAVLVAVSVAMAACTSSSEATIPTEPTTTAAPPSTSVAPFVPDFGQVDSSIGQPDEVVVAFVDEIIASNGNRIETIDTASGDRHTLLAVPALAIGTDPATGERFGSLDLGGDRTVVFETTTGDGIPHINILTAGGERFDVGPGLHPAVAPDGSVFAFLGPNGVTAMWSHESLLDDGLEVTGSITSMRFSPSGSLLAIAAENEGKGNVTIVEVTPNGFGASTELDQPSGRKYSLPAWVDDDTIVVLDTPEGRDAAGSVLTIELEGHTVASSTTLEEEIVDLDVAAGGVTILYVAKSGEIKWLGGDAVGSLVDSFHIGARW